MPTGSSLDLRKSPDGHTYAKRLLQRGGWALDVGCRGFLFSEEMGRCGLRVLALDPAPDVQDPRIPNVIFRRVALVGERIASRRRTTRLFCDGDGDSFTLLGGTRSKAVRVCQQSLSTILRQHRIRYFDIVKLDCEGAEYDILGDWPGPVATQISVEFHDFRGMNPCADAEQYYKQMLPRLGRWYTICQHKRTQAEWMSGPHYIDSLFLVHDCNVDFSRTI